MRRQKPQWLSVLAARAVKYTAVSFAACTIMSVVATVFAMPLLATIAIAVLEQVLPRVFILTTCLVAIVAMVESI